MRAIPVVSLRGAYLVRKGTIQEAFERFDAANPAVWELFVRFALEAVRARRPRFGAKMIWERMRWYSYFESDDEDYKLPNDFHSRYARKFMAAYPQYNYLFKTRSLRTP